MLPLHGQRAYHLVLVFILLLFPLQALAIQLGPVINADDGSTIIYPDSFIKFTWTRDSYDPDGFDVNLLTKYGNLTGIRPNINIAWGSLTVALPNVPPDPYNLAIYQAGQPLVQRGPGFTVIARPASSAIATASGSTVYVYTTDGQVRTTTVAPSSTAPAANGSTNKKKAPVGAIVGGVIGGLALLVLIVVILILLRRRRPSPGPQSSQGVTPFIPTHSSGPSHTRQVPSTSQVSLTHATVQDSNSSVLARENDELRDRIRALEAQQRSLEDRLLVNGVVAPAYEPSGSSSGPTQHSPR